MEAIKFKVGIYTALPFPPAPSPPPPKPQLRLLWNSTYIASILFVKRRVSFFLLPIYALRSLLQQRPLNDILSVEFARGTCKLVACKQAHVYFVWSLTVRGVILTWAWACSQRESLSDRLQSARLNVSPMLSGNKRLTAFFTASIFITDDPFYHYFSVRRGKGGEWNFVNSERHLLFTLLLLPIIVFHHCFHLCRCVRFILLFNCEGIFLGLIAQYTWQFRHL